MNQITTSNGGTDILSRIIKPEEGGMSAEAAHSILQFRLSEEDHERVEVLAAKAREGSLTKSERTQLEEYERVTAMIEMMQSKARLSLKQRNASA